MEYIKAEQFLSQTKDVQEIFLKWWNPSIGDLYTYTTENNQDYSELSCVTSINVARLTERNKGKRIPLFTEGQLRKFIEEKTGFPIAKIELVNGQYDIYTRYKAIDNYSDIRLFSELGRSVLQAYWKVACMIAKEELNV